MGAQSASGGGGEQEGLRVPRPGAGWRVSRPGAWGSETGRPSCTGLGSAQGRSRGRIHRRLAQPHPTPPPLICQRRDHGFLLAVRDTGSAGPQPGQKSDLPCHAHGTPPGRPLQRAGVPSPLPTGLRGSPPRAGAPGPPGAAPAAGAHPRTVSFNKYSAVLTSYHPLDLRANFRGILSFTFLVLILVPFGHIKKAQLIMFDLCKAST